MYVHFENIVACRTLHILYSLALSHFAVTVVRYIKAEHAGE